MNIPVRLAIPLSLLAASGAAPALAQGPAPHGNDQSSARPLAISAHFIKQVPPPKSPQIKCFAYTGSATFSLAKCRMTADRIISYYSDGQLSKVVAEGHVTLTGRGAAKHAEFKATGVTATYTYETDDITLKGKVRLLRYEGSGNAFGSQVKSVSYNVDDGTVGVSFPQYELYDDGKLRQA